MRRRNRTSLRLPENLSRLLEWTQAARSRNRGERARSPGQVVATIRHHCMIVTIGSACAFRAVLVKTPRSRSRDLRRRSGSMVARSSPPTTCFFSHRRGAVETARQREACFIGVRSLDAALAASRLRRGRWLSAHDHAVVARRNVRTTVLGHTCGAGARRCMAWALARACREGHCRPRPCSLGRCARHAQKAPPRCAADQPHASQSYRTSDAGNALLRGASGWPCATADGVKTFTGHADAARYRRLVATHGDRGTGFCTPSAPS